MSNPWLIVLIIVVLAVMAGECNQNQADAMPAPGIEREVTHGRP